MSVYIQSFLERQDLYLVQISDEKNIFDAYMTKSELESCHCVVNPEEIN